MNKLAIVSCLSFLLLMLGSSANEKQIFDCDQQTKLHIDSNVTRILVYGKRGRLFPENEQQVKPFCLETSQLIQNVEQFYCQCEPSEQKHLANVFAYSLKHILRTFCRKKRNKKLAEFIQVAPCLNKHINEDHCLVNFSKQSKKLTVLDEMGNQEKLKHICCNYAKLMNCMDEWILDHECSRKHFQLLSDYIHGLYDNLINVLCGDHDADSDRCDRVKPLPILTKDQQKRLKPYDSVVIVMMDVMNTLH